MQHKIDLDELARRLESVVVGWRKQVRVGPFTWRDEKAAWPQPITADRDSVEVPESLGLRIEGSDDLIEVCVWTGGWADIDWVEGEEARSVCPEFDDVDGAYAAVVQTVEDLLA